MTQMLTIFREYGGFRAFPEMWYSFKIDTWGLRLVWKTIGVSVAYLCCCCCCALVPWLLAVPGQASMILVMTFMRTCILLCLDVDSTMASTRERADFTSLASTVCVSGECEHAAIVAISIRAHVLSSLLVSPSPGGIRWSRMNASAVSSYTTNSLVNFLLLKNGALNKSRCDTNIPFSFQIGLCQFRIWT